MDTLPHHWQRARVFAPHADNIVTYKLLRDETFSTISTMMLVTRFWCSSGIIKSDQTINKMLAWSQSPFSKVPKCINYWVLKPQGARLRWAFEHRNWAEEQWRWHLDKTRQVKIMSIIHAYSDGTIKKQGYADIIVSSHSFTNPIGWFISAYV